MKYSEIYTSIQGEGLHSGVPSVFFRTSYCNIRCSWCDTGYTSWDPENKNISVQDAEKQILDYDYNHVVITGGEPFMWKEELQRLCDLLSKNNKVITIETNATIYVPTSADLISMSPKLSSSTPWSRDPKWAKKHERDRINIEVICQFLHNTWIKDKDYQFKFVIVDGSEIDEIKEIIDNLPNIRNDRIFLMPEGITKQQIEAKQEMVIDLAMRHGFRYCDRLHTRVWGPKRGV